MKKVIFLLWLLMSSSFTQAQYTNIPDANFEQELIVFGFDNVIDGQVLTANIRDVTSLDVSYRNISDLTGIQDFVGLQYLYCTNNLLTNLNVSDLINLQYLYCDYNQLVTLNVSGLNNLQFIFCTSNQFISLNIAGLNNLIGFYSQSNPNLTCVQVSSVAAANANGGWYKDATASYVLDCNGVLPPMAVAQDFCGSATVDNLVASGVNLKWYDTEIAEIALPNSTIISSGTYYVSQTVEGSESLRRPVMITINTTPTPAPSASESIYAAMTGYCSNTSGTFDVVGMANGKNVYKHSFFISTYISFNNNKWICYQGDLTNIIYESSIVPSGVYPPKNGWTGVGWCNATLTISFLSGVQNFCNGATVADLAIIRTNHPWSGIPNPTVKWYSVANGGNALNNNDLLTTGSYFASQTIYGCESIRTEIIVQVKTIAPTFANVAAMCQGASFTLPTTSIEGVSGSWSPAINNLATTTYTFTPDPEQCATSATMTIIVRTPGTIDGGNVTVCAPGTAFNSDGVPTAFTNSAMLTLAGNSVGSTIQWQRSMNYENATNATPAWSTVANNSGTNNSVLINGNTMTLSNLTSTVWYRVKVTSGSCVTYTNTTKITVTPIAKAGAISSLTSVCPGGSITFTSAAYKGTSIGWEVSTTSATAGFSTVAGENGMTYTMNNAPSTTFYVRSVVTSSACSIARSSAKTISVAPIAVAGTITGGGTFCSGANKSLKIAGCKGAIQWMYSTDGSNFMNVPTVGTVAPTFAATSTSGTASSYSINNITGTTYFKAVVKSGLCSSAETNVVVFNTATTATATSLSVESAQVCSGAVTSLYVPLNVGDLKFQKSNNWSSATPTWTTVNLKMTQTLYNGAYGVFSTGTLTQSTAYRVVSSIGNCAPVAYSDMAVIGVQVCAAVREVEAEVAITTPFEVIAYPNPSNNVFNFKVNGANDETVSILVFDMTGRQIENKVVKANNVENLALGQNYSSGVYNVIVSQGMNTKTIRLVKR